jgi:nucleotide-binding universal stress UspA family protein
MFRRILAPVDFTPRSRRAVGVAARLAAASKGEVTLLHVIERVDAGARRGVGNDQLPGRAARALPGPAGQVRSVRCRTERRT